MLHFSHKKDTGSLRCLISHTFKTTYSLYKYQSDCFKFVTLPYFRKRISRKLRFLDTFAPQMYPYSHPQPEPLPCFVLFLSVRIRFLRVWISLRPISSSQLHALLHFHLCPIYLVVFKGSYFRRMGYLILRAASRLDAFSVYPFQT